MIGALCDLLKVWEFLAEVEFIFRLPGLRLPLVLVRARKVQLTTSTYNPTADEIRSVLHGTVKKVEASAAGREE